MYYLLTDQLRSTRITTDASGAKISELRYDAWGDNPGDKNAVILCTPHTETIVRTQYLYLAGDAGWFDCFLLHR